MENIILPQSFSLIKSLFFIITTTTVIFTIKFWSSAVRLRNFYTQPSIIILGRNTERSPLITKLSKTKVIPYPENNEIKFSISNIKNKKLLFIEMPISLIKQKEIVDLFNKINLKGMILFSDKPESIELMKKQIKELESINALLENKPNFFVVDSLGELSANGKRKYEILDNRIENIDILKEKLASSINLDS